MKYTYYVMGQYCSESTLYRRANGKKSYEFYDKRNHRWTTKIIMVTSNLHVITEEDAFILMI